jgi:hypothetical protein
MIDFIQQSYIRDFTICDDLIKSHRSSTEQHPGKIMGGEINTQVKDSIDVYDHTINLALRDRFHVELDFCTRQYIDKYPHSAIGPFGFTDSANIQYYPPGGGFHRFHCERSPSPTAIVRHLAFMTYLNDVPRGGETEFLYQGIKVEPKKGLTLIWPADWTHTHRGLPAPTDKYIITGWLNFFPEDTEINNV